MSAIKEKVQFTNTLSSQDLATKATEQARAHLKAQGIEAPTLEGLSPIEYYDAMHAYSQQESNLIVQYMRQPSGPRPIAFDSTQGGKGWTSYND